jgi:hypothetical protein
MVISRPRWVPLALLAAALGFAAPLLPARAEQAQPPAAPQRTDQAQASAAPPAASCQIDSEIDTKSRSDIEGAAFDFTNRLVKNDTAGAVALLTGEAQHVMDAKRLAEVEKKTIQPEAPYSKLEVVHTYFVQATGTGNFIRAVCGSQKGDDWAAVAAKPGTAQAHVLVSAETANNRWAFTLWLMPENGTWRVRYFYRGMEGVAGKTLPEMLALARAERDAGRMFNASILYGGLPPLTDRGPVFRLGVAQTIQKEMANVTPPQDIKGQPPFTFSMAGDHYAVANIGALGIGNKLGLLFVLPHQTWKGEKDADVDNRHFIDAFRKTYPEYAKVFGFVSAQAVKPDNSGVFDTVYQEGTGYQ